MPTSKSQQSNEKGQSLIELAVSITFLLFLIGGVIDLGMAIFELIALRDAAQEGAAYAAVADTKDETDIQNRILSSTNTPINLTNAFSNGSLSIEIEDANGVKDVDDLCTGDQIRVSLDYEHVFIAPLLGMFSETGFDIPAFSTNTVLVPACPSTP